MGVVKYDGRPLPIGGGSHFGIAGDGGATERFLREDKAAGEKQGTQEQGRDAQGKFLPKQLGQTQPGSNGEKQGLDAVGATKNTQPIPGSNRIPDGTKKDGQYVEVKSGDSINHTKQVREMGDAAMKATGKPLEIVATNPNANVSRPVIQDPNIKITKLDNK